MKTMLSGCRALKGCERKDSCARYHRFLNSTAYEGFSATQTCRVSAFVQNEYPHFVPTPEAAMEERVQCSDPMGLYEWEKVDGY